MTLTKKQLFLEQMRLGQSQSHGETVQHFQNIIDKVLPMSLKQFEAHEKAMKKVIKDCTWRGRPDLPRMARELRALHRR